jgi:Domain of unknown function (DUF4157)
MPEAVATKSEQGAKVEAKARPLQGPRSSTRGAERAGQGVLSLQKSAGNTAVSQLIGRPSGNSFGRKSHGYASSAAVGLLGELGNGRLFLPDARAGIESAAGPIPQISAGSQAIGEALESGGTSGSTSRNSILAGHGGEPIHPTVRSEMESRFHQDFSKVRIHTGKHDAESAKAIKAKAYTIGGDIVFGENRYAPGTTDGNRLLAHELAHVVQQSRGRMVGSQNSEGELEKFAHDASSRVKHNEAIPVEGSSSIRVSRAADDEDPKEQAASILAPPTEASNITPISHQLPSGITPTTHQLQPAITAQSIIDDPNVSSKLTALAIGTAGKNKDPQNVKGAIVEEMMNREVQRRVQTGSGLNDLLPKDIAHSKVKFVRTPPDLSDLKPGEAAFVEGDRIKGMVNGKLLKLSDGMILLRQNEGFRVVTVFEAKAGQRRSSELHTTESGREDPTKSEIEELRKVKAETKKGKVIQAELGGQIRKDVERLSPEADDDSVHILVDGKPVAVHSSPKSTRFVGVVPHDLKVSTSVAKLRNPPTSKQPGEGINFSTLQLVSSQDDVAKAAQAIAQGAQPNKPTTPIAKKQGVVSKKSRPSDQKKVSDAAATKPKVKTDSVQPATSKPSKSAKSTAAKVPKKKASKPPAAKPAQNKRSRKANLPLATPTSEQATPPKKAKPLPTPTPEKAKFPQQAKPAPVAPKPEQAKPPQQAKPAPLTPAPAQAGTPVPSLAVRKPQAAPKAPLPPSTRQTTPTAPPTSPGSPARTPVTQAPAGKSPLVAKAQTAPSVPDTDHRETTTPGRGSSTDLHRGASVIAGPDQFGAAGSVGAAAKQEHGRGIATSQSVDFGGKVVTQVEAIPNTSPPRYRVTLSIDLSGAAEVGASRGGEGKTSASASGSASASLGLSVTHEMSDEQKTQYLAAVKAGAGGASEELRVAQLVAKGNIDEAKAYLTHRKSLQGSAAAAKQLKEGDAETVRAGGAVGAKGGAGGLELGASRSGELTITRVARGGKILVTVSVSSAKGTTVGGSFSEGVAGMGVSREAQQSRGKAVTFSLDPKNPNFDALYNEIAAANTVDDLSQLAAKRPELTGSTTTSRGKSSQTATSASVAGVGLSIKQGGSYSEEETRDERGTSHKYVGSGTLGGRLTLGGRTVAASSKTDQFTGEVGQDNKGSGETSSTSSEIDYGSSLHKLGKSLENKPLGTIGGLVTGNTKVLQERTEVEGKKLTDDSFSRLAELATDERAWGQSWHGDVQAYVDWQETRHKVLAANGDRALISKALAEFESEDSGRSKTVENAVSDTGIAFDFPDELSDQKPVYDELVASDPLAHARELEAEGKSSEALAEINASQGKLTHLQEAIRSHHEDVNPAALSEMLRRVSERRAELRGETRKLSSVPATKFTPGIEAAPAAPAADPQAEAAEKSQELKTRADEIVSDMRSNRNKEQENFDAIQKELDKEQNWFSKPDLIAISNLLNDLKPMYEQWDKSVGELKGVLQESRANPDSANQYGPNRTKWNTIHDSVFHW